MYKQKRITTGADGRKKKEERRMRSLLSEKNVSFAIMVCDA
jgi:hypothetical protein